MERQRQKKKEHPVIQITMSDLERLTAEEMNSLNKVLGVIVKNRYTQK